MRRIIAPQGSKMSLTDIVSRIQTSAGVNREELIERLFTSYGVLYESSLSLEPYEFSTGVVGVRGGLGITESLKMVRLQNSDPSGDRTLTIIDGYSGAFYIKHKEISDNPTSILDGFVWVNSGLSTVNTDYYDYYELTTTDPGTDGIYLADVVRSGSSLTITDKRSENLLKLRPELITNDHEQNTDTGTTSTTFKIGVGTLGNSLEGLDVLTEIEPPMTPYKPRILVIGVKRTSKHIDPAFVNKVPESLKIGELSSELLVTFAWNYDQVQGTGGSSGAFTITGFQANLGSDFRTFTEDELVGYRLYLSGADYVITANAATSGSNTALTVSNLNGTTPNLTGINGTSSIPARIHSNADFYNVSAIPVSSDGTTLDYDDFAMQTVSHAESPTMQRVTMKLIAGWKYKFSVTAYKSGATSSISWLNAGNYKDNGDDVEYDDPFLVKLPNIDMSDAGITTVATAAGFKVNIAGMSDATDFELVWTTDNAGADFSNRNHRHRITSDRVIEIEASAIQEYSIKCRPLKSGFVVCDPADYLSSIVVSGAGGNTPNDKILPYINVNLYAQAVNDVSVGSTSGTTAVMNFTSGGLIRNALIGKRFIDTNANEYEITENDETTFKIVEIDATNLGDIDDLVVSGIVYVGNTGAVTNVGSSSFAPVRENQRLIYQHTFSNDVTITYIDYDSDITSGSLAEPAVIRVYQSGYASAAGSLDVSSSDYFYDNETMNVGILGNRGNRTLVIDAWDPSGVGNTKRLKGILTVHYRDNIQTYQDNTAT